VVEVVLVIPAILVLLEDQAILEVVAAVVGHWVKLVLL
jgi:hypothetical protein